MVRRVLSSLRRRAVDLRDRLSLRAQLVAITAVLASIVAAGLVVVVQISLAGTAETVTQRVLNDRADALIAAIGATSSGEALTVPRTRLDPGVAIYDGSGTRVAGSVPPSMEEIFGDLSRSDSVRTEEGGEHFEIMATPFTTESGARGVVIITEPLGPYERDERAALIVSVIAAALLILMAAGSAAWISKRVLSPVREMSRTADEWSERDLERRFSLGPPTNEIRALGNTLDGLLDKVASAIRAEQRLTSELAHELRTPLTTIRGAADLLALRDDLDDQMEADVRLIQDTSTSMSTTISILLDIARRDATGTHADRTDLGDLADELRNRPAFGDRLTLDLPATMWMDVPRTLVVRALDPVLENALAVSDQVTVDARMKGRSVEILVADRGPGIPEDRVGVLFDPGWSGTGGSGLGLALARRVARSCGGDVVVVEPHNDHGGATFAVAFPGGNTDLSAR